MQRLSIVIIASCLIFATNCFGQAGAAALPFLLISPNAEANGMGETSVALLSNDPIAPMTNPAQLGMQTQMYYFSSGYNHSDWLPVFSNPDLWYRTFAFNAGINLKKQFGITPEISLGFGYSNIYVNEGEFVITGPGPTPLGTFNAHESSDQYTLGLGINYWLRASVGVTFKHINSSLADFEVQGQGRRGVAIVNAYDYGILLDAPCIDIVSQIIDKPVQIVPGLTPFIDLNAGMAVNNLGNDKVVYIDPAQADPLPRYARAGIGLTLGLMYNKDGVEWQPFSFRWTREANDLLVTRYLVANGTDTSSAWRYEDGLGDIKFFDELFLGHANPQTIRKTGWEFNLLELLSIRGGRFEEDPILGGRRFTTSGFGIQLAGFVKFFRRVTVARSKDEDPGLVWKILDHIDVRYNHSQLSTSPVSSFLTGTTFESINLWVFNR